MKKLYLNIRFYANSEIDFHSYTPTLKGANENQFPPFRVGVKKLIFHEIALK
ncbi:MAG TPA: hypothetical protein VIH57_08965 [Bacteroidales bacterium]